MTEKRFNCHVKFSKMPNGFMVLDYTKKGEEQTVIEDISREKAHRVMDRLNELSDENEQLKSKNRGLQSELKIFKEDVTHSNFMINKLGDENEKLKQQLDYIQNSITEHIKHQKTELGQKALKQIIEDYNEWLLGHKELNMND